MILTLTTAPAEEPISLEEAKKQLEIDPLFDGDNELLTELIIAARMSIEGATRRALCTQTWELRLDAFPSSSCPIVLPFPPLQSVTTVKYLDANGVEQTWSSSLYVVNAPAGPWPSKGTVRLAYGEIYPSTRTEPDAVRIRFVAGYGAAAAVPALLKAGVKLELAEMHQHRDPRLRGKRVDTIGLDYDSAVYGVTPGIARVIAPFCLPEVA